MCKLCLRTPVNHLSGLYKRKGARGMVRAAIEAKPGIESVQRRVPAGSPEGCNPSGRLYGIPGYNEGGVACLRPPTSQEHKELFL